MLGVDQRLTHVLGSLPANFAPFEARLAVEDECREDVHDWRVMPQVMSVNDSKGTLCVMLGVDLWYFFRVVDRCDITN